MPSYLAAPAAALPPLIAALLSPECYAHAVTQPRLLETHISWVILTGRHAYKIKKPLNLGFLDFSTLAARRHCCMEELRLNQRLAPSIYEAVVSIAGTPQAPRVDAPGAAIEYAVRMREFPQESLASRLLAKGTQETNSANEDHGSMSHAQIAALGTDIAAFHAKAGIAARGSPHGAPEAVIAAARENFIALDRIPGLGACTPEITELRAWTEAQYGRKLTVFAERQSAGYVREVHGDLHLGNIVMLEGKLTPFDCIEFNPVYRWIDVMSEVAFLGMDLMDRGRTDLAFCFLNAYLEASGDYAGLAVLRFYLVYRALVRAKVHALRAIQDGLDAAESTRLLGASRGYIELARRCAHGAQPAIILMHGVSGSGKSFVAQRLAEYLGAIRLRADVERKRLAGLRPLTRSQSAPGAGLYTDEMTLATYNRLLDITRLVVSAGFCGIADATFLKRWQRALFRAQAQVRHIPFVIANVTAPVEVMHARIASRIAGQSDASEANDVVMTQQLAQCEALTQDELRVAVTINNADANDDATFAAAFGKLDDHLANTPST